LTDEEAIGVFAEQIEGLKAGGADVIWIETMSALPEEMRAAAAAAVRCACLHCHRQPIPPAEP
jgi:5-methyltetrahydrofolate--homocysteine methyltransferase